jgi:flagellar L-ring protein precursor FlgH
MPVLRGRIPLAALLAVGLAGCADRLDHLGRPPTMTAPGAPIEAVKPISEARAQLAQRAPEAPPESYAVASLWRSGPQSLFGDRRARTVGDILTVVIDMNEEGSFENDTTRRRSGEEGLTINALLGLPNVADQILPADASLDPAIGTESSSRSTGSGATERKEEITLRVAATVTDVLPNGHFVIYGSQEVRLNFELRDLQVAGVVRPEDISRRNEITYDKIADARIAYGGRGQITDLQQPRIGQQVLDMVIPF